MKKTLLLLALLPLSNLVWSQSFGFQMGANVSILYDDSKKCGLGLDRGIYFRTVWDNELGIRSGINLFHFKVKNLPYATTDFFLFRKDQAYDILELPIDLTIDLFSQDNPPLISPVLSYGVAFAYCYNAIEFNVYDDSTTSFNFTEYDMFYDKYNIILRLGLLFRLNISDDFNVILGSTVRFFEFKESGRCLNNFTCYVGIDFP